MTKLKPIKPVDRAPLLHVSAQESLRVFIVDNGLKASDPLPPESALAVQLGISRNSMREAIKDFNEQILHGSVQKALESVGVLETRRGVGVFVKEFSFQPLLDNLAYGLQDSLRDVDELRDIRRVLEVGLIERTRQALFHRADLPTGQQQLYEITLEPAGGSPTGKPTGPVIVKGFGALPRL